MQIKYLGGQKFEVKAKEAVIILDEILTVDGFALAGPGEYEKNNAIINGISDNGNTIYAIRTEDINLGYLGRINHVLTEDEAKQIGDVDILFLPLGENGSADLKTALKNLSGVDPKVVIPMLYKDLTEFKKSEGLTDGEMEIFKIRKADLPEEERKIIILKA